MIIAVLTDIHGAYERAEKILKKESPDIVIVGGDLTTIGSVKEAEEAVRRFALIVPTVFCVAGNMDLPQHDDLFQRLNVSLNGHGKIHEGIGFFGVSAAPLSPLKTPYELSEDELAERIEAGYREIGFAERKIFVPHAPPYGTNVDIVHLGIHVGSMAVRECIEEHQPDVVVCGHIHEGRGQDVIGRSKIMNCGPAKDGYYGIIMVSESIEVINKKE